MFRRALNCAAVPALIVFTAMYGISPAQAEGIPQAPGHRLVSHYDGAPAAAAPLAGEAPPQHPFLAPNGRSGMHSDAGGSATSPGPGRWAGTRG